MKFKRNITRGVFIMGMVVLALVAASHTYASPLYGGYNGQSETWIEIYIVKVNRIGFSLRISVGVDTDSNVWIRIGFSSLLISACLYKIELSYETGDILSISGRGLLPLKIGADTDNLQWIITNLVVIVAGIDTNSNVWWETGCPGIYSGQDSNDNRWRWVKVLTVLVGWRRDLTSNQRISPSQENSLELEEEIRSLQDHFAREYSPKLSALLIERLTDDEVMEDMINFSEALTDRITLLSLFSLPINENREGFYPIDPLSRTPSELNALLKYAEEEIFTEEVKDEINALLDTFARDMQPRLRAIRKTVTSP
jgi:hypothetical protein